MEKITGFIITAGHLDIEWYQPLRSYRFWTTQALEDLKEAALRPDFKTYVLDGQVFPLEEYLEVVPEDTEEFKRYIAQGKLAVGPFYTQFDEWLPSAENMIRNCLYGKRKAMAYGGYMRAGYLPDNFGHPRQIPQILNNFGIDSLLFERGMPEVPGGHPDEFMYRGIDGSKVLVSFFREGYSGAFDIFRKQVDPKQPRDVPYYADYISFEYHRAIARHDDPATTARNMIDNVHRIKDRYPSRIIPLIAGADHLPPQINVGDSVRAANEMQDEIEFVMGSAEDYVSAVYQNLHAPKEYDMELIGSRYHYVLLGALSTRTYLKRQNFACEALLERYAEPLEALAELNGYRPKPRLMDEAWRYMMINSAHDSIHGSSVDEVHVEMEARYAGTRQIAAGVIHDALSHLSGRMDRWWKNRENGERGTLVYAPGSAAFPQPCEVWLAIGDRNVVMTGPDGKTLPTQVLPRDIVETNGIGKPRNDEYPNPVFRKVLFMDRLTAGAAASYATREGVDSFERLLAGGSFMENEYLRVEADGALINIMDKVSGHTFYNLNLLEEDADAGDAWDYSPPWIAGESVKSSGFSCRLLECGPVRAMLELRGNMNVPARLIGDIRSPERVDMPIRFQISIYRGIRRVDVKLTIDNTARDHRLRLFIPLRLKTETILSQGHLAVIRRSTERYKATERWSQPPTLLFPCREWVAADDGSVGLATALKGMYDYESTVNPLTNEPELRITLLRGIGMMGRLNTLQRSGPASDANDTPGAQCRGIQEMEWSYAPYSVSQGDVAPFLPEVESFLYPPVTHAVRPEVEPAGKLNAIGPAFSWQEPNIRFSAFKKCLDGEGYILRFFENQGKPIAARIGIGSFGKAWLSNMDEQTLEELPVQDGFVQVDVGAYKAVTLKLATAES